jgi:hypothetical protein
MKSSRLSTCELVQTWNDRGGTVNGNRRNAVGKELVARSVITVQDFYHGTPVTDCRFCAPDEACTLHLLTREVS